MSKLELIGGYHTDINLYVGRIYELEKAIEREVFHLETESELTRNQRITLYNLKEVLGG